MVPFDLTCAKAARASSRSMRSSISSKSLTSSIGTTAAISFPRRVRTIRSFPKAARLITLDNCSLAFPVVIVIDDHLLYQMYILAICLSRIKFVKKSSLQPGLAPGVDCVVDERPISVWECPGKLLHRKCRIDLENFCGCRACLRFPPG